MQHTSSQRIVVGVGGKGGRAGVRGGWLGGGVVVKLYEIVEKNDGQNSFPTVGKACKAISMLTYERRNFW